MIVLDTNVLSEPLRRRPDAAVVAWLGTASDTTITAISAGELLVGVRNLPTGRRRSDLERAITGILDRFRDRVLPYDLAAAERYAEMQERRRSVGRPLSTEDGMIAAICSSRSASLATRNVGDFADTGVELVNPWTAG